MADHNFPSRTWQTRRAQFTLSLLTFTLAWVSMSHGQALEFKPCSLTGSGGNGNLAAQCATWARPLNYAQPDGDQIELFVTKLASTALEPATDAFTIINGGPGGSSIDLLVDLAQIIRLFTSERDVIVIDQRGTGRSSPLLCDNITDSVDDFTTEETLQLTQKCLEVLSHDPRYFTTTVAIQDLEALRQALGYEALSLYGVSYGTRVAQQYMREFPQQTRAVVIDGVVPPTQILGTEIAIHSQEALISAFTRCAESTACAAAFPDLEADFSTLQDTLRNNPVPLTLNHPVTGQPTEIELSYAHLMAYIRFALYAPEMTSLIPLVITQAAKEQNYLPIAANALRLIHNVTESINYGMHNAVMCTEDVPFFTEATIDKERMQASYIGMEMFDTLGAMCDVWPPGELHPDMKASLVSDVPTLILSGEHDPITPPTWGEAVKPGLKNSIHIIAPGQGHGTIARGCIPTLIKEFIEQPDPNALDTSCVKHLGASPFFVSPMGPPP
ncbi:MAG: alpha/beta hydrolase [Pseudomonadota bacterium]